MITIIRLIILVMFFAFLYDGFVSINLAEYGLQQCEVKDGVILWKRECYPQPRIKKIKIA